MLLSSFAEHSNTFTLLMLRYGQRICWRQQPADGKKEKNEKKIAFCDYEHFICVVYR